MTESKTQGLLSLKKYQINDQLRKLEIAKNPTLLENTDYPPMPQKARVHEERKFTIDDDKHCPPPPVSLSDIRCKDKSSI